MLRMLICFLHECLVRFYGYYLYFMVMNNLYKYSITMVKNNVRVNGVDMIENYPEIIF